jgi:2-polyprenyl-3-methyl-5-hydroxy-6-metoxy-1,4-benzoquinol methylase
MGADDRTGGAAAPGAWRCPVCGGLAWDRRFTNGEGSEGGVSAASFVPSSDRFGDVAGVVVRCRGCGHGSLLEVPAADAIDDAYLDAVDAVSLDEEAGQMATAARDLARVEGHVRPGRLLDIGCWTGSFLVAATARGWEAEGIEPSRWACDRAEVRGASVRHGTLDDVDVDAGAYRTVVACDVLEHLLDPGAALDRIAAALEPGGVLFATVPDAGSPLARAMGRRWWAVLPMHVQYFTRGSMTLLLGRHGFAVESMATHPKVFSAGYYADRLGVLVPPSKRVVPPALDRLRLTARPVAPDLRDRMALIAQVVDS